MWKAQSCDHGNMAQHRHYWSDPYRGHADTNQAFWSPIPPTTTTRKAFQFLFISYVASTKLSAITQQQSIQLEPVVEEVFRGFT